MADDKSNTGAADRSKVAAGEKYEVDYEAKKLGITPKELKAIIAKVGNDRKKIEAEAKKAKK